MSTPRVVLEGCCSKVRAVVFSPDGSTVASGSDDRTVRIWDTNTTAIRSVLEGQYEMHGALEFSPDDGLVKLKLYRTKIYEPEAKAIGMGWLFAKSPSKVRMMLLSPDASTAVACSTDRTRLWDTNTRTMLAFLDGASWHTLVFSPDGSIIASGSFIHTVLLWNAKTGVKQWELEGHSSNVDTLVFSPDALTVAAIYYDNMVRLWNTKTGVKQWELEGHPLKISTLVFSPDALTLAPICGDNTVQLWDTKTGAILSVLEGHSKTVNTIAFSPDGSTVASGSDDGTVRLWYIASYDAEHDSGTWREERLCSRGSVAGYISDATTEGQHYSRFPTPVRSRYSVDPAGSWILKHGSRLLWLPVDVRPRAFGIFGTCVALGASSGRLTVLHFIDK